MKTHLTSYIDSTKDHGQPGSQTRRKPKVRLADLNPELALHIRDLDQEVDRLIAEKKRKARAGPAPT